MLPWHRDDVVNGATQAPEDSVGTERCQAAGTTRQKSFTPYQHQSQINSIHNIVTLQMSLFHPNFKGLLCRK